MSLPSQQLPPLGTYSGISGLYNSLNNSYAGGRFYFVGATYDESLPAFALRDLAFKVTPISGGTISVTTNLSGATFTLTGPANYSGGGTSFTQGNAPAGAYTIT
ncbi:MAG: hypothetical protein ACHP7J_07230, partial [Terriglobales bacterium]